MSTYFGNFSNKLQISAVLKHQNFKAIILTTSAFVIADQFT
jgi:hypothetical protein